LSASSYFIWGQNIEGQNLQQFAKGASSAKPFTLSFWVKAFQTGTYVAELYDNTNSRQVTKTFTINASATWEYKTIQFPADATGALVNSNANAFSLWFWLVGGTTFTSGSASGSWSAASNANRAAGLNVNGASSTSNYFQFTGIQLEQNYQPTPFEQRPIGVELGLCQRYYYRQTSEATGVSQRIGGYGAVYGSNTYVGVLLLPVPMRIRPTSSLEYSGLSCTDNIAFDSTGGTWSISTSYGSTRSVMIYGGPLTGALTVAFAQLQLTSSTGSYIGISAEL
jgi:hypothetical protein